MYVCTYIHMYSYFVHTTRQMGVKVPETAVAGTTAGWGSIPPLLTPFLATRPCQSIFDRQVLYGFRQRGCPYNCSRRGHARVVATLHRPTWEEPRDGWGSGILTLVFGVGREAPSTLLHVACMHRSAGLREPTHDSEDGLASMWPRPITARLAEEGEGKFASSYHLQVSKWQITTLSVFLNPESRPARLPGTYIHTYR